MGTGKRRWRGSDDGRRARKTLSAPGLIHALDWLDANDPTHARRIWADIGPDLRRRPGALLSRLRELMASDPARYGRLWADVDRALYVLTVQIGGGQ